MKAQEFKKIRKKLKLNQAQIAKELRVSVQTVKFYETDRRPIPGPVAKLMHIFYKSPLAPFWKEMFIKKFDI